MDDDQLIDEPAREDGDDEIIGVALRRSGLVLAAIAVVALGIWLWMRRPVEEREETVIETTAPQVVEREAEAPPLPFTDVTAAAGIDFEHFDGAAGEKLLPETMGSGAAFFDYDGDDDPDLFLVNGTSWLHLPATRPAPTSRLYANDGSGSFRDVSSATGLDLEMYGTGVAVGDYDADGRLDLFVAAVGANRLLRNAPGGFVDVTAEAGVAGDADEWSTGAAFFDADADGDLDLFVCNYVRWSRDIDIELDYRLTGVGRAYGPPVNYEGTFSYLYRNDGDGTFTDVSEPAGIRVTNEATGFAAGKGLGVVPVDVEGDGLTDLLVANDTVRNFFFHNQGGGVFEEVGEFWGLAYGRNGEATGAMGLDAAHYRNDGELGFAIGNFANEMTSLYLSQGDPTLYADEAISEGIGAPSRLALSFGVLFFDADLDGRLDLLQANGHLESEINTVDPSQTYEQPSQLFWNAGPSARQGFVPVAAAALGDLGQPIVGRGAAVADVDGDGDEDVVLTQAGRRAVLLRNDQATGGHWLRVALEGTGANTHGVGARVELTAGGVTQRRTLNPARSYLSQSEPVVGFGLGAADAVDELTVIWPDGSRQPVSVDRVDRLITVRQERGEDPG